MFSVLYFRLPCTRVHTAEERMLALAALKESDAQLQEYLAVHEKEKEVVQMLTRPECKDQANPFGAGDNFLAYCGLKFDSDNPLECKLERDNVVLLKQAKEEKSGGASTGRRRGSGSRCGPHSTAQARPSSPRNRTSYGPPYGGHVRKVPIWARSP